MQVCSTLTVTVQSTHPQRESQHWCVENMDAHFFPWYVNTAAHSGIHMDTQSLFVFQTLLIRERSCSILMPTYFFIFLFETVCFNKL